MKKINHGEYEKYYVSGINDAIVDKLDFEKVQELLAIRGQKAQSACCEHPLSRKLICVFCGATFKKENAVVKNITGYVERTMRMRKSAADSGCQNQKFMKCLCGFTIS